MNQRDRNLDETCIPSLGQILKHDVALDLAGPNPARFATTSQHDALSLMRCLVSKNEATITRTWLLKQLGKMIHVWNQVQRAAGDCSVKNAFARDRIGHFDVEALLIAAPRDSS
jgi:hypothetical protein